MKRPLLCSTAGIGILASAAAGAAEVKPGGALDITISGSIAIQAPIGDLKEKTGEKSGSYDLNSDNELDLEIRGSDESTGIEYGAILEIDANTDAEDQMDEVFTFVRGGFGEFRFGDTDGVSENMSVGAYTLAVGSGGIDGDVIDTPAVVRPTNSDDATKVIYYTPEIAGFQGGVSFTPHAGSSGTNIGVTDDGNIDDLFEGGLAYTGELGEIEVISSVVGTFGHVNQDVSDDDVKGIYGGAALTLDAISVAAGWGTEEVGGADRSYYNLGAGYEYGPLALSLNWGQCYDCDDGEPTNLIGGIALALMPGLVASLEVSLFDEDRGGGNDDGVLTLSRLELVF